MKITHFGAIHEEIRDPIYTQYFHLASAMFWQLFIPSKIQKPQTSGIHLPFMIILKKTAKLMVMVMMIIILIYDYRSQDFTLSAASQKFILASANLHCGRIKVCSSICMTHRAKNLFFHINCDHVLQFKSLAPCRGKGEIFHFTRCH